MLHVRKKHLNSFLVILIVLIFVLFTTSCSRVTSKKIIIVSTSSAASMIAKEIGKDKVDVYTISSVVEKLGDTYPTMDYISKLATSNIFIYSSIPSDSWVEDVSDKIKKDISNFVLLDNYIDGTVQPVNYETFLMENFESRKAIAKTLTDRMAKINPDNDKFFENNYQRILKRIEKIEIP